MPGHSKAVEILPISFAGDIHPGDSICEKLVAALQHHKLTLEKGDILVVKHKIISKAEGRLVDLTNVKPSRSAARWALRYGLDPRVVELAVSQSRRVVRRKRGVLITQTRHGFVCANSGIDVSNVDGGRHALLLPEDPDRSAEQLHRDLKKKVNLAIPVIISDSFGRPWREGLTEVAIGVAGMKPLRDHRGHNDPHGYTLKASVDADADQLACAAGLVCGKLARTPACIIRGFAYQAGRGSARQMVRAAKQDLFR